jgi:hypothetical protein
MLNRAAWPHGTHQARAAVAAAWLVLGGCASQTIPDPRVAAQHWEQAVRAGDESAMYSLLTDAARRAQGRQGVARLLQQHRAELQALARSVASPNARLDTTAEVAYPGDRAARVVLEGGGFKVAAAGALPAAAASPRDALRELRDVLARRSFAGLLRVLTRDTAQVVESSLQDFVNALDEPSALEIELEGRRATARLPGGHTVQLEHEDGVWRVKDFD